MDARIRIITILGAVSILLLILELVRRRKLKEEYSVLWVATAIVISVLAVWYELLDAITKAMGGVLPSSTLFFFGLVFVLILLLHFSVRVSSLERQLTAIVQEMALRSVEPPEAAPAAELEVPAEREGVGAASAPTAPVPARER